jgi:two-component system, NtrC family, nitrogen regulation sensor histidine kinase NtrY
MSFRRRLLAVFALTIFLSVSSIAWIVSIISRRAFERANEERTAALISQFQREFNRRGDDILRRVQAIASSDAITHMVLAAGQGTPDYGGFLNEARSFAESQQLDFLEFVTADGTIISSAQSPAKFGYKDPSISDLSRAASQSTFLKIEDVGDAPVLGLFAVRAASAGDNALYVVGGRKLDRDFLATIELPVGMRAMLYPSPGPKYSPSLLIAPATLKSADSLGGLIEKALRNGADATQIVHWSANPADDETAHALPLKGLDDHLLGVLLITDSRRNYVELKQHIQSAALLVGGLGILLAVIFSSWAAARVTRPVEDLARAAQDVAAGNLSTQVHVNSSDELGQLADAFNQMTHDLVEQKDRLVQTERVAAWRELARRLAHELKNPLFPLQLTVENLVRAREQNPTMFDEIFRESAVTLLAEISNLKTIINRFSEFSKMPQPHFQRVHVAALVDGVLRLYQPQFQSAERPVACKVEVGESLDMAADPELLHRVLSNLVLNAIDAMPQGGTLTIRAKGNDDRVHIEVSDTGIGLTPEECSRLFTPYYTSKQHGTGLGLAIVQSVISDHGGKISVQSEPGRGATFVIDLPRNLDKLSGELPSFNQSAGR